MNIEQKVLHEGDLILSKCGRPIPPERGVAALDIPHSYFYQSVVPDESTQQQYVEITGQYTFYLRAISGVPSNSPIYIQIKFPSGHFFQQSLRDITQMAGAGSNRYNMEREVECPPGSKIWITADTTLIASGDPEAFSLLFDGVLRIWMRSGQPQYFPKEQAAILPRVFKSRNQNLMAPRWMTSDYPGDGQFFVYSSSTEIPPVFALPAAGAGIQLTTKIPTDVSWEFLCARFFATFVFDDGSSGTPYVRIRDSSGYQLTDDFVNLANLSGNPLPGWWKIGPGRDIILDVLMVEASGSGNCTFYFYFEGLRRRPN